MNDKGLNTMKLKNQDLVLAIKYWTGLNTYYKQIVNKFNGLILIADIIVSDTHVFQETMEKQKISKTQIIENLVAGIVLFGIGNMDNNSIKKEEKTKYAVQLMQPIIDEIVKCVKSDDYNKSLIKHITGHDEYIVIGGVTVPLKPSKINRFRKFKGITNVTIDDGRATVRAFISDKKKTFIKPPKNQRNFVDYLKHDKPEQLAQKLKEEFSGMTGKTTALFIFGLKNNSLLKVGEIKRQPLHKLIKEYWQSNIGTPKTVNDYLNDKYEIIGRVNKAEKDDVSNRIGRIRNSLL